MKITAIEGLEWFEVENFACQKGYQTTPNILICQIRGTLTFWVDDKNSVVCSYPEFDQYDSIEKEWVGIPSSDVDRYVAGYFEALTELLSDYIDAGLLDLNTVKKEEE